MAAKSSPVPDMTRTDAHRAGDPVDGGLPCGGRLPRRVAGVWPEGEIQRQRGMPCQRRLGVNRLDAHDDATSLACAMRGFTPL